MASRQHGPRRVHEKPKNFKSAISKLFKYLHNFVSYIVISVILATIGAVLSILGPNKLSDLTDEISKGLILNQDNLSNITEQITSNLTEEKMNNIMKEIMTFDFSSDTINNVLSSDISTEDKQAFTLALENKDMTNIPNSVKEYLITSSTYNNVYISKEDKISLLSYDFKKDDLATLPDSIKQILFPEFIYEGIIITTNNQIEFLKVMSNVKNTTDTEIIYKNLDKLPNNIKELIKPSMNMSAIKKIGTFLIILYLLSALFNLIQGVIMATVSNRFAQELREKISIKINKLPLKYFDRGRIGDILSRITNDVDTISMSMNQSLSSLVGAITLFIGSIIMMFVTNGIMAVAAILSSIFGFIFMFAVLSKSQKYFKARQVELGKLNSHIEEIYSSHNVVKIYGGEKDAKEKFDKLNTSVYECNRKSQFLSGLMPPMMAFVGNFSYVVVCVVGASLVINGNITFGVIVAFIIYVRLFTSPLSQIAQGMTSLQSTAAASERVFEFLEEEEMEDETDLKEKIDVDNVKGEIEFEHVKFGYNENKIIIKDFSAKVKPGSTIAIVGPTGAGKTTIVNLLMKFYKVGSGDIKIDGISINNLTRENIHDLFIMVLQDTWVYNGTIRDNIKYNNKNINDEEIWKVLKTVGLEHFVKSLPGGLDYIISDNDSISAGQRQLLTIARGMIKNSPLLILDEATSNVDTRTEELVSRAMDKLMDKRTSFIIAHRLSTIKNADMILVMKDGNIIETGNHDELMSQNGFYADLYNSQFEN